MMCLMTFAVTYVQAYGNDYLEQQDHYNVYAKGVDVIHFKVPVYSRGTYNYCVGTDNSNVSEFYFKWYSSEICIFTINADRYGDNNDDDVTYGTVSVRSNSGTVEITNIYNGTRAVVPQDNKEHKYNVTKTKEADNDKDYVTWLEIDWYPPTYLDKQPFSVHSHIKIFQSYADEVYYKKDWDFGNYTGADMMTEPQLYDPVFYVSKESSLSGYGCAAVPYVVYHDLESYHTSFNSEELKTTKRAENIYVQTTDTLQTGFKAMFNVYRRKTPNVEMVEQTTNAVTIPAYHRIYDFTVTEEKDEFETFTGRNVLSWTIKNPKTEDLVQGDYFEVQRALKSDFSDAQNLESVSMDNDGVNGVFSVPDDSRDIWSGNAAVRQDTLSTKFTHEVKDFELSDAQGNRLCKVNFTVTADNVLLPTVPVYYRIRRASASMWGWKGHDFAREYKCVKHNFLAPLAATQADYTVNSESHQVDFRFVLENKEIATETVHAGQLSFDNITTHAHQMDENHIRYVTIKGEFQPIREMEGKVSAQWYESGYGYHSVKITNDTVIALQPGSELYLICSLNGYYRASTTTNNPSADDNRDARILLWESYSSRYGRTVINQTTELETFNKDEQPRFEAIKAQLADSLAKVMGTEIAGSVGKCMWDRSARLVLEKTVDGFTHQIIIPQDSIRRLENGNWEAHYVDVADHACTDYRYAVRIDQSHADLHVSDSAYLQPITIHGPNLYFDEGASINSFTASSMEAEGKMKRGIMLQWEPTSAAVDNYVLLRRAEEGAHADTVYTGVDNSYFDTGVSPEHTYLYTIQTVYDCNGRHSEHYAETTGQRSPYGEIRGQIQMSDFSGMAGVTVSLQNGEGQIVRSFVTGADGSFVFDSLTYDYAAGSDYVLIPASQYGIFRFNNTSATTATVRLTQDNCIVRDLVFMNSATVRLSGRALYKGSTIPVSGALFLLNGDTIRRNGAPVTTGIDGTFELTLTTAQPYTLQIVKAGHTFEGEGILHVEQDKDTFALTQPLDGVRFYDQTKVRLVGRVAGGNIQRDLPEAFGLGTNNLGADLQLVLQLEGDNTAHFVHDPNDLSRDTVMQTVEHEVYERTANSQEPTAKVVGTTSMLMEKKRIVIHPDQETGEYEVDLYPVKYKVVQASAKGYATLFASGQGSEVFDLTNAPLTVITDSLTTNDERLTTSYNAIYDRIYHTPVQIHLQQLLYGMPQDGYGEESMKVSSFNIRSEEKVALYTAHDDGTVDYTLGYPVFYHNRKYQFEAQAYEEYFYNNDHETGTRDRVPQRGGVITIHNGMESATHHVSYQLDSVGKNRNIYLNVTRIETELRGDAALHTVSTALEMEGNTVETEVFRAFVAGDVVLANELRSTDAAITVLDIIRDPGGNGSSAWVESGSSYTYSYKESYDFNFGVQLTPTWGSSVSTEIGTITGAPGTYTGMSMNTSKEFSFSIPVTHEVAWGNEYTYNFTTNDKITTSAVKSKQGIGANADVFLGVKTSVLAGKAKCISVINDTLYQQRQPAIQSGAMHVLAQGMDSKGKPYYLVIGEKIVFGSQIDNTFAYTQHHILHSVLPRIFIERDNLLEYFADSAAAQKAADQRGEEVYWYIDSLTAIQLQDRLKEGTYKMITPSNSTAVITDRVGAMERMIENWMAVISKNEEEKIKARYSGQTVGVYSVSAGTSYTHTESFASAFNYSHKPQLLALGSTGAAAAGNAAASAASSLLKSLHGSLAQTGGKIMQTASKFLQNLGSKASAEDGNTVTSITSKCAGSTFQMVIEPVLDIDLDYRSGQEMTNKKNVGFTIMPDKQGELTVLDNLGEITVAVYRAEMDSVWKSKSEPVIDELHTTVPDNDKYGSYVFFTQSGSTYCMFEDEDTTLFYNKGTKLSNPTLMLAKPEMSINTYEQANVLPDQKATFKIELRNAGEIPYGWYNGGVYFTLSLYNNSNPDGAKIFVNGAALAQGMEYYLEPGQSIVQTLEVERGDVDDYENLQLCFQVSDCPKNWTFLDFSVHFIPLSSDVQIDMPRQNWVMNTLSQRDSTGYYIPVEISGFDTHYKNFDHIEFQYKLSKESEEMWVTAMSFYAEDSLYNKATGNKAMIENGRIMPFRFYGEKDPIEQEYDLRAVSFCRYGSGYVHKASPVISGTKDTRPPRVFGQPQPVNSVLGVGDDLKLRFSEPIAGNYLDADNNFNLTGVTNQTGITAGTSLHFDGSEGSYAITKVNRDLADKSVSIDLLVKPVGPGMGQMFFANGAGNNAVIVGLDYSNRLFFTSPQGTAYSKPLDPMLEFTHVTVVYDHDSGSVRFFAGTKEMTNDQSPITYHQSPFSNAPLIFGRGFNGNMLEVRVWAKALTPEEVAAMHMKRLTGYERGLVAYYPMNEGRGTTCTDKANGATLYLNGTSWTLQKGISIRLKNDSVALDGNLLSRSDVYDETFMLWFKSNNPSPVTGNPSSIFRASTAWLGIEDGLLTYYSDSNAVVMDRVDDESWHHFALSVNRAYNTASFFLDGQLKNTVPATQISGIRGAMYLGGKDFSGAVDELIIYEQALPRSLIEERYSMSPAGDEMGLMAYLPFEEQILNPNGVLELVFSPYDQRIIKRNGQVVEQKKTLLIANGQKPIADYADFAEFAPIRDHGLLTKLNYDWSFNNDELLINLNMEDYEINKQTVYVTVRDVEDLHGNPMSSPVTWVAYVDRNTLKWEQRNVYYTYDYEEDATESTYPLLILNTSGRAHQFTIDNIPDWLTLSSTQGTMNALEQRRIELTVARTLPPGEYMETVYLTDENGLAEPLNIHLTVVATPPYDNIDKSKYPYNMSVCAQVLLDDASLSADKNDIVYAFCNNECVGMEHVSFSEQTNSSDLYLTIYGSEAMTGKKIHFVLWRASTGKTSDIYCWRDVEFEPGKVMGCGNDEPLIFVATTYERQTINLAPGWNWISFHLLIADNQGILVNSRQPWEEGDLIKNPATMQFATYSVIMDEFMGDLKELHHQYTYMVYCREGNRIHVNGELLHPDSMSVVLHGKGDWSALPYLLQEAAPVSEVLADYYDNASPGDLIKSHDRFAVFSSDGRWQGNLTTLRPGEGYFFRRLADNDVTVRFYDRQKTNAPKKAPMTNRPCPGPMTNDQRLTTNDQRLTTNDQWSNPKAATNMTMIARIEGIEISRSRSLEVFVAGELAAVATPIDSLYFLTIQSDRVGELRFETEDGERLEPFDVSKSRNIEISYIPDAHAGSLKAPIILVPVTGNPSPVTRKLIINDHVVIIRNGIRYDVTGKKLD